MIKSALTEPGTIDTTEQDKEETPLLVTDPQPEQSSDEPVVGPTDEEIAADKEQRDIQLLRDYHDDMQEQGRRVKRRQEVYEDLKSEASDAKKSLEVALKRLAEMSIEPPPETLWTPKKQADSDTAAPVDADDEAWRETTLSELGITGKIVEHLTEAELTTLGDISDYTSTGKQLTDITGIGPGNANKISDACDIYWAQHPRKQVSSADDATTDVDGADEKPESTEAETTTAEQD